MLRVVHESLALRVEQRPALVPRATTGGIPGAPALGAPGPSIAVGAGNIVAVNHSVSAIDPRFSTQELLYLTAGERAPSPPQPLNTLPSWPTAESALISTGRPGEFLAAWAAHNGESTNGAVLVTRASIVDGPRLPLHVFGGGSVRGARVNEVRLTLDRGGNWALLAWSLAAPVPAAGPVAPDAIGLWFACVPLPQSAGADRERR